MGDARGVPSLRVSHAAGELDPPTGRETRGTDRAELIVRTVGYRRIAIAGAAAFPSAQVTSQGRQTMAVSGRADRRLSAPAMDSPLPIAAAR